jgi:regulator of RNase E activity RraA
MRFASTRRKSTPAAAAPAASHADLLRLRRYSTPTISNGLELACPAYTGTAGFNVEETRDFMPHLGPMIGYAVTATYCASRRAAAMTDRTGDLLDLIERSPKPCIVVIRDADSPRRIVGAPWGECFGGICRALGAVGTITDGALRDYDEMMQGDFKVLARRLCVSHAYGRMIEVGKPVKVFGVTVRPGQLIHADKHGFLLLPKVDLRALAEKTAWLDGREIEHIIAPARRAGYSTRVFLEGKGRFVEEVAKRKG